MQWNEHFGGTISLTGVAFTESSLLPGPPNVFFHVSSQQPWEKSNILLHFTDEAMRPEKSMVQRQEQSWDLSSDLFGVTTSVSPTYQSNKYLGILTLYCGGDTVQMGILVSRRNTMFR